MLDLSANMFYKVKFSISAVDSSSDMLWALVLHVKNWQCRKWNKRGVERLTTRNNDWTSIKLGNRIRSQDNQVYIESEYFHPEGKEEQFWACRITESPTPRPGYAQRQWITEIGYEQVEGNAATISCVLSYVDRPGFIGPYQSPPSASIPKLITNIVNDPSLRACCGSDVLDSSPVELVVGDWPSFWEKLSDPNRQLPYIYISPLVLDSGSDEVELLLDPGVLASTVFGNAVVFFSKDPSFSREMSYMADEYSCYGGAVRVYQPSVSEAYRHRYLSANQIREMGPDNVIGYLRHAFAQNANFYDSFFRIDDCKRKKEEYARKQRQAEIQARHLAQLQQVESKTFDLAMEEAEKRDEEEAKRLEAESRAFDLELQNEEYSRRIYSLETQIEHLRSAAAENAGLRQALDARLSIDKCPTTPADVVRYFSSSFADRLVFSEDAIKSLKDCTIDPGTLWQVFFALANTMRELYEIPGTDVFAVFREKTGIDVSRGEGAMTRKDKALMRQFETRVGGETVDIEAHITYPRQRQSIHFGYSPVLRKVVVGHCGEHLDNYSTRKLR